MIVSEISHCCRGMNLSQADLASSDSDPDTLPQKYYTVMIERIPANLRSAEKLYEYFEELFPGRSEKFI